MFARDWTILPHNVTKLPFSAKTVMLSKSSVCLSVAVNGGAGKLKLQ